MKNRDIKLLILEDDEAYIRMLLRLLNEIGIHQVYTSQNFQEAVEVYNSQSIDLLLVDINLGRNQPTGDEFVRYIQKKGNNPLVLYLTSLFTEYYYEQVKDTQPVGFMDKEVSKLALLQAIELAFNSKSNQEKQVESFSGKHFFFKVGNVYKSIDPNEIYYFYAHNKMTYAKVGNRNYPTNMSLKNLEKGLDKSTFLRIHKSYLVNVNYVEQVDLKNDCIQVNGEGLRIGEAYRKEFMKRLKIFK